MIGLAGDQGVQINEITLSRILAIWPALRESVYRYIARADLTVPRARAVLRFLSSGHVVDESGLLEPANFLAETAVTRPSLVGPYLAKIISTFGTENYHGYYAALWLTSKYGSSGELLELVSARQELWFPDETLGRLVAGMYPRFWATPQWAEFQRLIAESRNRGARDVYKFHVALVSEVKTFDAMFSYLSSPNISRSTGITHAKYLCLLSALRNQKAEPTKRKKLRSVNKLVWRDTYYRTIAGAVLKEVDALP